MLKHISFFLLLVLAGSRIGAGDVKTLTEAKVLSAKTNKPILLDFMTDW